jgi:hypothetical protein
MKSVLNVILVIIGAIILIRSFFWFIQKTQVNESSDQTTELTINQVRIKDLIVKEQGYGVNVIAEIENLTSKEIKLCEVIFTWYDKQGKLIDSAIGIGKNLKPNSTGIVDSYFDEIPKGEGATCKATFGELAF